MNKQRRDILKRILERVREYQPTFSEEHAVQIEHQLRQEFGGSEHYIPKGSAKQRTEDIKKKCNGRNIEQISVELNVHRSTIYRALHRK